jgi:hypothetical protein
MRKALLDNKLITEEEAGGMFIETIDGHTANVEEDGCTWLIKDKAGKDLGNGMNMDEIKLHAGDELTLQYFVVPNFDD